MNSFYLKRKRGYKKMYWGASEISLDRVNGFRIFPEKIYKQFVRYVERGGRILDLGCGNGQLLKYLCTNCQYKLEPFGVDFLAKSIKMAQKIILPKYSVNFYCKEIVQFKYRSNLFDFIIFDPYHVASKDRKKISNDLFKMLTKKGKIIIYSYADSMVALGKNNLAQFGGLQRFGFRKYKHIKDQLDIAYLIKEPLE